MARTDTPTPTLDRRAERSADKLANTKRQRRIEADDIADMLDQLEDANIVATFVLSPQHYR